MEERFEDYIDRATVAFWLLAGLLTRSGIELPLLDPRVSATRPVIARTLRHLDTPGTPQDAQTAVAAVVIKWLTANDLIDGLERDTDPWREEAIKVALTEFQYLWKIAWAELDKNDTATP